MIPDEAVEAAAKVTFEHTNFGNSWDGAGLAWKVAYRDAARAALEAAAPHMLAGMHSADEVARPFGVERYGVVNEQVALKGTLMNRQDTNEAAK